MPDLRIVWISWEQHRRSRELAAALGARLCVLTTQHSASRLARYLLLASRTLALLIRMRPEVVVVQNPSVILALVACLARRFLNFVLVVDRHSNFKREEALNLKIRIFHRVSDYTIRNADLTIVTNPNLSKLIEALGGHSVVLPDKLPLLNAGTVRPLKGGLRVAAITTFADDEPITEMVEAVRLLDASCYVYMTGNHHRSATVRQLRSAMPENLVLTGFLEEESYQSLLMSADLILVLTTYEDLLTCGAYEGLAVGKPMVLSDTRAIREFFRRGALYARPDRHAIAQAIRLAGRSLDHLTSEVREFAVDVERNWEVSFGHLCTLIHGLAQKKSTGRSCMV